MPLVSFRQSKAALKAPLSDEPTLLKYFSSHLIE